MTAPMPFAESALPGAGFGLPEMGFGGATIGTLHGPVDETDAAATLEAAWAAGIRYYDTAPLYGAGLGERRVGGLLAGRPRASFRLSTKVGWLAADGACHIDYGRQATVDGLMASLDRLGVDRVDIAYIHDLDPYNHGDAAPARFREAMAGAYPALAELRRAGRVGAIGIGVNDPDVCLAALDHGDFDLFLMAGRYTLIDQGAAGRLLPACLVRGARVVVGAPFNTGILATGAREGARFRHRPADAGLLARVSAIERVAARHGVPLPAAALQFPLRHPGVVSVLPGPRTAAQTTSCAAWMRHPVPPAFWDDLVREGLLPEAEGLSAD
ncbi:D-threo-aldose 1-dehydrogenase [Stella humosa]|uniref:D-threo-aldose 1-dehydrogenase n=1 Tax=Stella humosa TaxID=94 RepID=A0A3N1KRK6_9PROT|nr:aldo/keto reductase [Stella humosa]ROP81429.1 D-threo-aldose 1-dehydrogenase [Stella humosa]BBK32781.1 D-threo-aldose 1-dehydrogenase [Stella humosa]